MIYGYLRVSTDAQTLENQRYEINNFCKKSNIAIDKFIEETITGTRKVEERQLGKLLKKMNGGDILVCTELSRIGRSLLMIMSVLNNCMEREIQIWTTKELYKLGDNINSKVLAFAFGLSAEIERNLISQRTKEALARKKAEGVILGRPKGSKASYYKLTGKENLIISYISKKYSYSKMSRLLKVERKTITNFIKRYKLNEINI